MARPAPAKFRNDLGRTKRPPPKKDRKPRSDDSRPDSLQALCRTISSLALNAADTLGELKETHRAFGCLESLMVPVEIPRSDEFYVTPTELRALVALVNAEFGRRIGAVGIAIEAILTVSATPRSK